MEIGRIIESIFYISIYKRYGWTPFVTVFDFIEKYGEDQVNELLQSGKRISFVDAEGKEIWPDLGVDRLKELISREHNDLQMEWNNYLGEKENEINEKKEKIINDLMGEVEKKYKEFYEKIGVSNDKVKSDIRELENHNIDKSADIVFNPIINDIMEKKKITIKKTNRNTHT